MPANLKTLAGLTGVGTGLDIASSLYGIISGIQQQRQGRRMVAEAEAMPGYQVSPEARQRLGLRQTMLGATAPAFEDLENDIFANQAGTVFQARQAAPGSAALLGTVGTAQAETNRALRQAAMQEAAMQEERVRGLESAQEAMARENQMAYQYNTFIPQQRKFELGGQMMGVGQQNIFGGIRSLAGTAGNLYRAEAENSVVSTLFRQLMGGRTNAPQSNFTPMSTPTGMSGLQGLSSIGSFLSNYLTRPK